MEVMFSRDYRAVDYEAAGPDGRLQIGMMTRRKAPLFDKAVSTTRKPVSGE